MPHKYMGGLLELLAAQNIFFLYGQTLPIYRYLTTLVVQEVLITSLYIR